MNPRLVLCAGLIAATACGRAPGPAADRSSPAVSPAAPTPSTSPTPPSETRSDATLLFGVKKANSVTVKAVNLRTRTERTIFTHAERAEAEHSGNWWDEQPPSVALSPDGRFVAYGADDGLHVYDLKTSALETLVRRVADPKPGSDDPPKWSPDIETYSFVNLRWSGDGRFLSFDLPQYEGNRVGFYDRTAGKYFDDGDLPFSYVEPTLGPLAWAQDGSSWVVPASGTSYGLFFSGPEDPGRSKLVRLPYVNVGAAALSADASRAAFLFSSKRDYPDSSGIDGIAVMKRDGNGLKTIDTEGEKSSVAFDLDGDVLWTEGGTLHRWNGSSKTVAARLDPAYTWVVMTADAETITVCGRSEKDRRALFLSLQRSTGKALHSYGVTTEFVTFLGVI
jgi:WD40 repeat protein